MIYFIANAASRAVKVGVAVDVSARLRTLRTASADELTLLGFVPGDAADEARWHRSLAPFRRRGEWFDASAVVLDLIAHELESRAVVPDGPFAELVAMEPRLEYLFRQAVSHHPAAVLAGAFCANAVWYGYAGHPGIKQKLVSLVGWSIRERHPVLGTREAYDTAYDAIYGALPDCQERCACQSFLGAFFDIPGEIRA